MASAASVRRTILLLALALTVAAIFYPIDGDRPAQVDPKAAVKGRVFAPVKTVARTPEASPGVRPQWLAMDEDPFAPRGWLPPPPVQVTTPQQVAVATVVDAPPPSPAPLPFKVLGRMVDGNDQVVYLKTGEQVLLARSGDVLEGSYRVVAISPTLIEFESTDAGLRQSLPLSSQDN